jgi:hypothetical protein
MVERFKNGTFVYPGALFRLTPEELAASAAPSPGRSGWVNPMTDEDDAGGEDDDAEPQNREQDDNDFDNDDNEMSEREVA